MPQLKARIWMMKFRFKFRGAAMKMMRNPKSARSRVKRVMAGSGQHPIALLP